MTTRRTLPVLTDYPLPSLPGEALYVPPTPNGEGRACHNCVLWVEPVHTRRGAEDRGQCIIHDRDLSVWSTMVCGYHLFGHPLERWATLPGFKALPPALTGLVQTPFGSSGTRCGSCRWFSSDGKGLCMRVAGSIDASARTWTPAEVDEGGCCAQWEGRT